MWIDTRERNPEKDGNYLVQIVTGIVKPFDYTVELGWNSYINSEGFATGSRNFNDDWYIVRWFEPPVPAEVPKEWYDGWIYGIAEKSKKRKEANNEEA